jgi:hypothetical protein
VLVSGRILGEWVGVSHLRVSPRSLHIQAELE